MFTGLVQDKGIVLDVQHGQESAQLKIKTKLARDMQIGDSISINGVCLTAVTLDDECFTADVMVQTLKLTSLRSLKIGDEVNAELAARLDTRLGGHIVQGHVDAVGQVVVNSPGEKWQKLVVQVPADLCKYIVNQGSICIDGVSLTVGAIDDKQSEVTLWLIPETLAKTNLGSKQPGDLVNLEVDVLAKYVERLIAASKGSDK